MPEGMTRRLGGRFALEREIGEGGMARVFLGRDEVLDRLIAIKVLRPHYGETGMRARFEREGRTAARLSHPNIVEVYDAGEGELEGRKVSYIVMEYVPGGDLKQLMEEKGPVPGKELARLGAEVSSGLARAHEAGVVHRDIKPANILIDSQGRPKLSDFGIARALSATQATQTGTYLGTALYSSPEQLKGEKVTPKSDVYSLGITLYQAATGEPPFSGTPLEVASQHVSRTPTPPSVLGADLSGRFEKLILDCVEKDPDLRPTAEEVHERLRREAGSTRNARAYAAPPMSEPPPAASIRTPPREQPPQRPPPGDVPGGVPDDSAPGRSGGEWRGERRRRGPVLLVAAALFLILVGIAVASALTGGNEATETAQEESQQDNEQGSAPEETPAEQTAAEESTVAEDAQEDTAAEDSEEDLSAEDAAQAVQDYYTAAADGDYDLAWSFLSTGYQQQFASQAAYTSQFDTLNSVEFVEGPTPEVSGETATVTGGTVATHTNRVDRTTGTWTLINEDDEWKIDGQSVSVIGTS